MFRRNLLSLLLAVALILLSNFSQSEVSGAMIGANRHLLEVGDTGNYQQQYLRTMNPSRRFRVPRPPTELELLNALRKRQIRYHPCYFNPVSCFRRK
ncbi:hypothetical protein JTE90_017962 [Oedothorax gibbosus]|uniref:Uncharacterized protein n=1 Tax=Oedothorax gibbosus TaxID=931172 RepID=A0AAV6V715_9ARAC|nr:hypothetical protein JTE90_017962 [Oedothorax gibbosus]